MIEDQYMLIMTKSSNLSTFDHAFNHDVISDETEKHHSSTEREEDRSSRDFMKKKLSITAWNEILEQ
jgi:hypothetical protein